MYYLHGGAGVPNFGDELIVRQWLDFLKDRVSDPITVSGMRVNPLKDLFAGRYPNHYYTEALSHYQSTLPKDFWGALAAGYAFLDDPKGLRRGELDRLMGARVFHLHGGGYINKIWPNHTFYLGLAAALKKRTGCRIVGTGLGLTPSPKVPPEQAALLKEVLMAFDHIEVRDHASFSYVIRATDGQASVVQGLDDVFLAPVAPAPGPRTLHLSLHNQGWADVGLKMLRPELVDRFERVLFWTCHYKDEARLTEIRGMLPRVAALDVNQLTHEPLPLGADDMMITSRFHPHMQAARAGLRGQYLAHFTYSRIKHFSVLALGSRFTPVPYENPEGSLSMKEVDTTRTAQKQAVWEAEIGDLYRRE